MPTELDPDGSYEDERRRANVKLIERKNAKVELVYTSESMNVMCTNRNSCLLAT